MKVQSQTPSQSAGSVFQEQPATKEAIGTDVPASPLDPSIADFFADQGGRMKEMTGRAASLSSDGDIPEMFQEASGDRDVLNDWLTGQLVEETEESRRKFLQVLASAKDPSSVILAITQKHSQESLKKIGQLMEVYQENRESLDHLQAEMDLMGGEITQADMMQTNMKFARNQADSMNLFQAMQKEMSNYERTLEGGQSLHKADNADQTMIQNMKG